MLSLFDILNNRLGLASELLTACMTLLTLTFLITIPKTLVPNLGSDMATPQNDFPYLSGADRLVIKDIIMIAVV